MKSVAREIWLSEIGEKYTNSEETAKEYNEVFWLWSLEPCSSKQDFPRATFSRT